jgi:hypothetical protein
MVNKFLRVYGWEHSKIDFCLRVVDAPADEWRGGV